MRNKDKRESWMKEYHKSESYLTMLSKRRERYKNEVSYRKLCHDKCKKYRENNVNKLHSLRVNKYSKLTPERKAEIVIKKAQWRTKSDKDKITRCNYYQKNKKRISGIHMHKFRTNYQYRIRHLLRNQLRNALNKYGDGKIYSSNKYGIDYNAIIEHLKPFPQNMQEYHIDHINPLYFFDLTDSNNVKEAFSPSNLRWLTAKENLSLGGKLTHVNRKDII